MLGVKTVHLTTFGGKRSMLGEYESMLRVHLAPGIPGSIARVTPRDVEGYIAAKTHAGLAPKTVGNHLGLLHSIFAYAERRGWGDRGPVRVRRRSANGGHGGGHSIPRRRRVGGAAARATS